MAVDARRLEELCLNSSAPSGQLLYDGWLLRFSPGKARRARSINAVYPSRLALEAKVAHCGRLYGERGLPANFRLSGFTEPPELDGLLGRLGYERFNLAQVQAASLEGATLAGPEVLCPRLEEWFDMVGELRGSPLAPRRAHLGRLAALAIALYRAFGFAPAYRYWYRGRPGEMA